MTGQVGFALRGRNPDVLTCIANLSNDEVFTPPEFANKMLDTLAEAWAADHDGANIWADKTVTFLDPCTKSGVFLREITTRLTKGLAEEIPDLQKRVDHILTKQVFGIAITQLTSLLARRSLYCSKHARGEHSIVKSFKTDEGHIWFRRLEHTWQAGKCSYCGANARDYDRGALLESHAYAFIHTDDIKKRLREIFGGRKVQFDVIVGNPPYQLGQSGGEAIGNFAMPIYQRFIQAAKLVEPRYLIMVTPSRWFAGGRGLEEFRQEMLGDRRLRVLVDHPDSREVFPGVDIAGGISYFLWDANWQGKCQVATTVGGMAGQPMERYLDQYDVLVRYNEAIPILDKVIGPRLDSFKSMATQVGPIQPFSIRTNVQGRATSAGMKDPITLYQKGGVGYMERGDIPRNIEWLDEWKVFLSATASEHGGQTDKNGLRRVFSKIQVGGPGTACTETYLVAGRFSTEVEARNLATYLRTKFVRFLVALRTNTQHLYSERFAFVPKLPMGTAYSDAVLYKKFNLTASEVDFIEGMIRPMGETDD